ncbi:MAG: N-acetylneuraminate synthase [bacterium]
MKKIRINNRWIGDKEPVFIIAEAGVNHNGKLCLAKKLVDIAKEAGADAVKFQTFKPEDLAIPNTPKVGYQRKYSRGNTQFEMLKKLELKYEDFQALKEYCDKKGIIFLSTPHTESTIDFLKDLVPAYKIASGDLTNLPLLQKVAKKKKPIILSTGMSNLEEVKEAVKVIKDKGNRKIILLHCVSNYPASLKEVNLYALELLREKFDSIVGFSDHTQGSIASIVAIALGAKVIEKHFTLSRKLYGPDHKTSLDRKEFIDFVRLLRQTESILGERRKSVQEGELENRKIARKSVVARINIPKGTLIKREILDIKRPGTGIASKELYKVIGKKANRNILKDTLIKWEYLA